MNTLLKWGSLACVALLLTFSASSARAEDPPAVDKVIQDLAAIGPEALVARVAEMRARVEALRTEATALREKAAALEADSNSVKAQIQTLETFMANVAAAMQPAPPPPAPPAEAPAAPAPPAEAAPAPAPPAEGSA